MPTNTAGRMRRRVAAESGRLIRCGRGRVRFDTSGRARLRRGRNRRNTATFEPIRHSKEIGPRPILPHLLNAAASRMYQNERIRQPDVCCPDVLEIRGSVRPKPLRQLVKPLLYDMAALARPRIGVHGQQFAVEQPADAADGNASRPARETTRWCRSRRGTAQRRIVGLVVAEQGGEAAAVERQELVDQGFGGQGRPRHRHTPRQSCVPFRCRPATGAPATVASSPPTAAISGRNRPTRRDGRRGSDWRAGGVSPLIHPTISMPTTIQGAHAPRSPEFTLTARPVCPPSA